MIKKPIHSTFTYCILLIFMDFVGLTISIVVFPELLLSDTHSIFLQSMSYHHKFILLGCLLSLYPLGQFFGASAFGKLSDAWGRKATLQITLLGTLAGVLLTAISISQLMPVLLFASRFITGVFAGNAVVAQAILMDISNEKTKGRNISFGQAAMGSAYILGPILGAYLSAPTVVSWFNFATPFWFFCPILLLFILFTKFYFTDTLQIHEKASLKVYTNLQSVYKGFKLGKIRAVISIWLCFCFGWWLFEAFIPAYLFKHFSFSTIKIGHLLSYNGSLFVLSQMLIVGQVLKKIKPEQLIKYTVVFAGLAMISLAYVSNEFIYLSMTVFVLSMSFSIPSLILSISNLVGDMEQGQIMGIINAIQAFASVLVMLLGGMLNVFNNSATIIGGGLVTILAWALYLMFFNTADQEALSDKRRHDVI